MARSYICGFEMGTVGEFNSVNGSGATIQSAIKRTGSFALEINGAGNVVFQQRANGGTLRNSFYSCRFYLQVGALPSAICPIVNWENNLASTFTLLSINTDGTFTLGAGSGAAYTGSTSSTISVTADGLWHLIQVELINASSRKLFVDGVLAITDSSTGGAASAANNAILGSNTGLAPPASVTYYIDDVMFDDGDAVIPGGSVALLLPISDNARGGWTAGAGGTTNLFNAVKNVPPAGLAVGTNTSQVKDAVSSATDDYDANVQSYTTGGLVAGSTVNAVMPICTDGQESTTGTKSGDIRVTSNPSDGGADATRYDYGDAGVIVGAFPTGWVTHTGAVTVPGSQPTLGNSPVVRVGKRTATTRVVDVCFMGLYVDYTPGIVVAPPLLGPHLKTSSGPHERGNVARM